ncbi:cytochrome o ubiquinol oxidase subunit III [Candidatus Parcubacteria bacterium]|nr:cytochrome o ubiquinol oxidase subunit III [Candidatus Parcubacteria bacterium]
MDDKTQLGFWIYLMTDIVLFATLFATYIILHHNTFGGPGGSELFSLPFVLLETMILLTSSFTAGLGLLAGYQGRKQAVLTWFAVTFALGAAFLGLEIYEFAHLVHAGHSWTASAFLSAFFTLVGTHGLHITAGLIWMATIMWQVFKNGLIPPVKRRLTMLSLFWHFLDIVWIFIFTIVYLIGGEIHG